METTDTVVAPALVSMGRDMVIASLPAGDAANVVVTTSVTVVVRSAAAALTVVVETDVLMRVVVDATS